MSELVHTDPLYLRYIPEAKDTKDTSVRDANAFDEGGISGATREAKL